MMTKPPGFASSSTLPLDDEEEESIDESLDEILLEAHERPLENSSKSLEAVPSSLGSSETDDDDDVVGVPTTRSAGSLNLPGTPRAPLSEITVIAPRPTFFDEVREEETKVDPYETAIRAAASRNDGLAGLTSQASQQRDRALRKASLTPPRLSAARPAAEDREKEQKGDVEFEDPDAIDESARGASAHGDGRTPADIPISEDDESAPTGSYNLNPSPSGGLRPALPPPLRTSPPPGRPDIYPGRRIPTPSSDFLPVPSGGFGSGSHYPSIAIPAPSLLDASGRASAMRADNRLRLPAVGLIGFLVTAFGGGLLVGALLWRGHAASPPREQPVVSRVLPKIVPKVVPEAMQPIVVKPVPAPAIGKGPASAPAAAAAANPAPSIPTLAAETPPAGAPPGAEASRSASKKTSAAGSRAKRPVDTFSDDDANLSDAPPPPPKPTRSRKKAVVWQDPFAQ
jgi:hypothetical protein